MYTYVGLRLITCVENHFIMYVHSYVERKFNGLAEFNKTVGQFNTEATVEFSVWIEVLPIYTLYNY